MFQLFKKITLKESKKNIIDITSLLNNFILENNLCSGILNISILHTTASLFIQENYDPKVLKDLENFFDELVPMNKFYLHSTEGKDDMPAHIKSALTNTNLTISVQNKSLVLGTWQAVYLFEHRTKSRTRILNFHFFGENK